MIGAFIRPDKPSDKVPVSLGSRLSNAAIYLCQEKLNEPYSSREEEAVGVRIRRSSRRVAESSPYLYIPRRVKSGVKLFLLPFLLLVLPEIGLESRLTTRQTIGPANYRYLQTGFPRSVEQLSTRVV